MAQSLQTSQTLDSDPTVRTIGASNVSNRTAHASTGGPTRGALPYGYHNSFHTHSMDSSPPTYEQSQSTKCRIPPPIIEDETASPPPYICTVQQGGVIGLMMEFKDPFMGKPTDRLWQRVYASLRGTQLSIHWVKFRLNSKKSTPQPGKMIAQFSLQHAEVGLAVDVRPAENIPKSSMLQILPTNVREKLMKTKPQLFETQNEWLLRIRVEGFQFLMSLDSEDSLLDWCEKICTSIDISPPIDDRTDPRYRSLPRRSRRQRQLESFVDGVFLNPSQEPISLEALNDRLVQQQERILRTFYPNLANAASGNRASVISAPIIPHRPLSTILDQQVSGDQDMDEFDPDDVMEARAGESRSRVLNSEEQFSKSRRNNSQEPQSPSEADLRFRRRCMPIMYKCSARGSDIIFYKGTRWRIDHKRSVLRAFELNPPRYPRASKKLKAPRAISSAAAETSLQSQQLLSIQPRERNTSYRTCSGYSGRVEDSDTVSVASVANTTGSAHDGIESVSRIVSMLNSNDEIVENPHSPDVTMMLKEKATIQDREASRLEQVSHTFSSLVL